MIMQSSEEESQYRSLTLVQRAFVPNEARRPHDARLGEIKASAGTAHQGPEASGR